MKNFIHHIFRQFQNNEHEEREMFDTIDTPTENPETIIFDALKTAGNESIAAELLEQNADKPDVLQKVKDRLQALKGSEAEKGIVDKNLENLRMRAGADTALEKLGNAVNQLSVPVEIPTVATESIKTPDEKPVTAPTESEAKKIVDAVDTLETEVKTEVKKGAWEYVKNEMNVKNWKDWSDGKKVSVALATLGAAGLLYGAYRWFSRKKEANQGAPAEKKSWKRWLLWIPVIGTGAYFYYRWQKNHPSEGKDGKKGEKTSTIDKIKEGIMAVGGGIDRSVKGVSEGVKLIREELGPAADHLINSKTAPILRKYYVLNEYGSRTEFLKDFAGAVIQDGGGLVWDGSKGLIVLGSGLVLDAGKFAFELGELMLDPSAENLEEVMQIYVEGMVVYASSTSAFRLAMRKNPVPGWKETVAWPFMVFKKGGSATWNVLNGEIPRYIQDVTTSKMKFFKYAYLYNETVIPKKVTIGMFQARKEMVIELDHLIERAKTSKVAPVEFEQKLAARKQRMVEGIKSILQKLDEEGKLPPNMKQYIQKEFSGQKVSELNMKNVEKLAMNTQAFESAAEEEAEIVKLSKIVKESRSETPPKLRKAAGGENMPEPLVDPRIAPDEKPNLRIFNGDELEEIKSLKSSIVSGVEMERAFDGVVEQCVKAGFDSKQITRIVSDPTIFHMLHTKGAAVEQILKTAKETSDPTKALQRLAIHFTNAETAGQAVMLDAKVLQAVLKTDVDANVLGRVFASKKAIEALRTMGPDDVVKAINGISAWKNAGTLAKSAYVAGAFLEAGGIALDIVAIREAQDRKKAMLTSVTASLEKPNSGFRKISEGIYEYTAKPEIKIEIKAIESSVDNLNATNWARLGVDSAGFATTLLAPSFCLGPGGLIVAGVIVTVHGVISAWEQNKYRDLMLNTPTPILTMLGVQRLTGMSEHEVLADASNGMISDEWRNHPESEKRVMRRKTLGVLFAQALSNTSPLLQQEILKGGDVTSLLDDQGEFFQPGGEFDLVVSPYLAVRTFDMTNDKQVTWKDFSDHKIDQGWFDATNVSPENLQKAMKESVILYGQHVREKRYKEIFEKVKNVTPAEGPITSEADLQKRAKEGQEHTEQTRILDRLKGAPAIQKKISEIDPSIKETTVESWVAELYERQEEAAKRARKPVTKSTIGTGYMVPPTLSTEWHEATRADMGANTLIVDKDGIMNSLDTFMKELEQQEPNIYLYDEANRKDGDAILKEKNAFFENGIYSVDAGSERVSFRYESLKGWFWRPQNGGWNPIKTFEADAGRLYTGFRFATVKKACEDIVKAMNG